MEVRTTVSVIFKTSKTSKALVADLKNLGQDFEWYPTTDEIMDLVKKDMMKEYKTLEYNQVTGKNDYILGSVAVLDCGAGDGRVVKNLSNGGDSFAIEKSTKLIEAMSKDIFIIGTDFFQSTLIDKKVDVIFCNPPYSEYESWATKIITECNCKSVYLVIPQRWKKSKLIEVALKTRGVKHKVLGSYNFLNAERKARAVVEVVVITMVVDRYDENDPFDSWFDTNFKLKADRVVDSEYTESVKQAETLKEKLSGQLTKGRGVVQVLVELYGQEMEHLQKMFLSVCELDPDVLKELNVSSTGLKAALKQRVVGLKAKYWQELFGNYSKITYRLTHASRKTMLDKLIENTSIDFTELNVYAVTIWVIKNANSYYDTQLVALVESMITDANVVLYKSNKRLFTDQDWRYGRFEPKGLKHFGLELRMILHNKGGVKGDQWSYEFNKNLANRVHEFLDDIQTVAGNLGFVTPDWVNSKQITEEWTSGKKNDFYINKGTGEMLMSVKAFKNGNMHIKFGKDVIRTLNVEFGRLKGWLSNHIQASEELGIPVKQTVKMFNANTQLTNTNGLLQIGFTPGVGAVDKVGSAVK